MIGLPPVTVEPDTCTALAPSTAALAAATISEGDFDATPLPDDPPHPPSAATASASKMPVTGRSRTEGSQRGTKLNSIRALG